jgi:hypothetical protein
VIDIRVWSIEIPTSSTSLCRKSPFLAQRTREMEHPRFSFLLGQSLQWARTKRVSVIKTVNLKSDMPEVEEALQRLDRELALARKEGLRLLKVVHGLRIDRGWRRHSHCGAKAATSTY